MMLNGYISKKFFHDRFEIYELKKKVRRSYIIIIIIICIGIGFYAAAILIGSRDKCEGKVR